MLEFSRVATEEDEVKSSALNERTTNYILLHLADECLLLGMTGRFGTERIDEPVREMLCGSIVFPFCGRYSLGILVAILRAKDAKIDMACGRL